jgi:hypothetical protein
VRSDRDRSVGPAAPGSAAAPRVIGEPACRRMDDAEDRDALIDERDVDRVLTVPGEELARPVERVDQPEPAREPFDRRHAFFRDHDGAGIELRESLADQRVRGEVGPRERRVVGLAPDLPAAFALDPPDRRAGVHRGGARSGEQRGEVIRIETHGPGVLRRREKHLRLEEE